MIRSPYYELIRDYLVLNKDSFCRTCSSFRTWANSERNPDPWQPRTNGPGLELELAVDVVVAAGPGEDFGDHLLQFAYLLDWSENLRKHTVVNLRIA